MVFISNLFNTPDNFHVCKPYINTINRRCFFFFLLKEIVSVCRIFFFSFVVVVGFFFRWPDSLVKAINLTATGGDFTFNMQAGKKRRNCKFSRFIFFGFSLMHFSRNYYCAPTDRKEIYEQPKTEKISLLIFLHAAFDGRLFTSRIYDQTLLALSRKTDFCFLRSARKREAKHAQWDTILVCSSFSFSNRWYRSWCRDVFLKSLKGGKKLLNIKVKSFESRERWR